MTASALVLLAGVLGLGGDHPAGVQALAADTLPAVALDVPFVAQGPLLCGGAAVAMVERFWGARGVYGEDFQHLVRPDEGGIRASELSDATRGRGYDVSSATNDPGVAFAAVRQGIPPILLLESGATRLHYVVLVAMDGDSVWIHDPNFGPHRPMTKQELLERWSASGYWALLATPAATAAVPPAEPQTARRDADDLGDSAAPRREGAARHPGLVDAMERLRLADFSGARAAVRPLIGVDDATGTLARRVLATGWYLEGEPTRALEEWNALGEPVIDLVRIEGARATRHHVIADRISLDHGDVLSPGSLLLARRRLAQLPAVSDSRVEYSPVPEGTVEVVAFAMEHERVPGLPLVAVQGLRGLVNRRAALELGPLMAAGDRWRLTGGWAAAQRYVEASVSTPAPPFPGIATVGLEWRRERFAALQDDADPEVALTTEKRRRGWLGIEEWIHPAVRVGASLALESWDVPSWSAASRRKGAVRMVNAGTAILGTGGDDRTWASLRGDVWSGAGRSFGSAGFEAATSLPRGERREWRIRVGGAVASPEAPRTLWPGAGTDGVRDAPLRGHGLVEDGAIRGPAFGRQLVHGTIEHRFFRRAGPLRAGVALFVDMAQVWSRPGAAEDRGFVDVGGGVFVELGKREGAVSLARGSSGWRLSAQLESARP